MKGNLTGVSAALVGNVVIALGLNFQKLSHLQIIKSELEGGVGADEGLPNDEEHDTETIRPASSNPILRLIFSAKDVVTEGIKRDAQYLKNGTFWLGLALTTLGESSNFIAYGLSPAPLVAPLGSCALVANCIFSPLLLRESFGTQEIIGSALCIIGAFVLIASNTGRDGQVDYDTLLNAIERTSFQVYVFCLLTAIAILIVLSNKRAGQQTVTVDVSICALFGGLTVISTKALSSLLVKDFAGAFHHQVTYIALSVLLVTAAAQVHFLNKALNRFDSKIVIPTQYIFFTISVILGSSVLFNDLNSFPYLTLLSGLTVSFCGVYFLSRAPQSEHFGGSESAQRQHSIDSAHSTPVIHAPQRIQTTRSHSSLTKVGIGLSPARYLLAGQSPSSTISTAASGTYLEGVIATHDEHQALLDGRLPQSYNSTIHPPPPPRNTDLIDAYDLTQTGTPTAHTSGVMDGERRGSNVVPNFSSNFLVNYPAEVGIKASPRSKLSNLFAGDHLAGSLDDGEVTPRQQYVPTFATTSRQE